MKNFMPVYNEIARIPLFLHLPGDERAGTRSRALTQTIDLMPDLPRLFRLSGAAACVWPIPADGRGGRGDPGGRDLRLLRDGGEPDRRTLCLSSATRSTMTPARCPYTAMPVQGLNHWYPRSLHERIEMGRYFGHTYNLPLYKIPAGGARRGRCRARRATSGGTSCSIWKRTPGRRRRCGIRRWRTGLRGGSLLTWKPASCPPSSGPGWALRLAKVASDGLEGTRRSPRLFGGASRSHPPQVDTGDGEVGRFEAVNRYPQGGSLSALPIKVFTTDGLIG